ncbi:hypothetical protein OG453_37860 [Streptomyces sp. NBC_01381]|uniref:hypothetical protein n=1 Tax=Streptomyces sp. NBC_01381 TaxID=2903845 RepID=UPI00224E1004|nr:hypothetical protein [Streptomyces sp. NBC_01381]MCX4672364.1 hypothetical protein [Streptomyces sp. NBC_01381]
MQRTAADATRAQLARQLGHWTAAADRLGALDDLAAPAAWAGLEQYLGVAVRRALTEAVSGLRTRGHILRTALRAAHSPAELDAVRRRLLEFRQGYLRAETSIEFYADAVNTRTSPHIAALLRACDSLAQRSMAAVLDPLLKPVPAVLTYLDNGVGAAILKAGLRLWDGSTESPAATIKVTRHSLLCPTAVLHECGHQVAFQTGWNEEAAALLARAAAPAGPDVAALWAGWSSEITADVFAFAHAGYGAVANLHDVLSGGPAYVFRLLPGDPHPVAWLRVPLNTALCRHAYGPGPWDALEREWLAAYPLADCPDLQARELLAASLPRLPALAAAVLDEPLAAFAGRPLTALVPPQRVAPQALRELAARLGPALYTSPHWLWNEGLRLLALTGWRAATEPEPAAGPAAGQEAWLLRLGGGAAPAA